jgi:putative heme-binding domain-containing protein
MSFNNSILVADCVLNLVHIDALVNQGSTMSASRIIDKAEFLASNDRSFRPVNMAIGPDGALYVVDMHREVIEHPEWIPDELEATMDLEAGKDKGRIYKVVPKGPWSPFELDLNPEDAPSLVAALGNQNQWIRLTAQRLLVSNQMTMAVPLLKVQLRNSDNTLSRLHALWTLEGLHALENPELKRVFQDAIPELRENAVKIAERRMNGDKGLIGDMIALTIDKDSKVRMQAVLALGVLSDEYYAENAHDIRSVLFQRMSDTWNDEWATKAIAAAMQRQALPFSIMILKDNKGPLTKMELDLLILLAKKIGKDGKMDDLADLLGSLHELSVKTNVQTQLIEALAQGWEKGGQTDRRSINTSEFLNALGRLEGHNDVALIRAKGRLRQIMQMPSSDKVKALMRTASVSVFDPTLTATQRLEQLRLIGLDDFKNRSIVLFKLLDSKQPLVIQEEALSQLGEVNDSQVGLKLLELWPLLGPNTRKRATDILLYKSFNHHNLLTAMETGKVSLGEFNLDLERRRVLLFSNDQSVRNRAKLLFNDAGVVTRKAAIEKMRPALTLKGSADAGAKIFKVQCAQCHRYGNIGKEVGPVLTEVSRKSKESLLYDILDPNAAVDTQYLNHWVKTKEGSIFSGLVSHENDLEITLKMIGGSEKTIPKSSIEQFTSLGTSLMVEGLESNINPQEMANLLAFLQQTPSNF